MQLNNVFLLPCIEWELGGGLLGRVKGVLLLMIAKWMGFCIYNYFGNDTQTKVKCLQQCFCSVTV